LESKAGAGALKGVYAGRQRTHSLLLIALQVLYSHENTVLQILELADERAVDVPDNPGHHLAPSRRKHLAKSIRSNYCGD